VSEPCPGSRGGGQTILPAAVQQQTSAVHAAIQLPELPS
jgi:hypothetical protein